MSLSIDGLNLSINGRTILDQVDLRVADGQRVGLIGSSGSGKSMIARSVLGTAPLTASLSGSILVDGLQILGSDDRSLADLRGSRMGMIFQNPSTALDAITQRQIVDLLVSLVDQSGASLLFITHDFSVLARVADYCYILDAGRVVESGQTQSILHSPCSPQGTTLVRAARELTLSADGGKHEAD